MEICILLFALFVVFILVMRARRRFPTREAPPPPVFETGELQALLAEGKITAAEYDRLSVALAIRVTRGPIRGAGGFDVIQVDRKTSGRTLSQYRNPPAGSDCNVRGRAGL